MPTTSASSRGLQVAALQKEMEEVAAAKVATKAEAAAAAEDWSGRRVRLQADFDNLRARNANQTLEAQLTATTIKVVQDFLPVLDNLDRARTSIQPEGDKALSVSAAYDEVYSWLKVPFGSVTDRQPGLIGPICCG